MKACGSYLFRLLQHLIRQLKKFIDYALIRGNAYVNAEVSIPRCLGSAFWRWAGTNLVPLKLDVLNIFMSSLSAFFSSFVWPITGLVKAAFFPSPCNYRLASDPCPRLNYNKDLEKNQSLQSLLIDHRSQALQRNLKDCPVHPSIFKKVYLF